MKVGNIVKTTEEHSIRFKNCDSCRSFSGKLESLKGHLAFVETNSRLTSINKKWLKVVQ